MSSITIQGGTPLFGSVKLSGSPKVSQLLLIISLFSNEEIYLDNIPRVPKILRFLETLTYFGVQAEWVGNSKILINASSMKNSELPHEYAKNFEELLLLIPVLCFRFGSCVIPIPFYTDHRNYNLDDWIALWNSFNYQCFTDNTNIKVVGDAIKSTDFNLSESSPNLVLNALLCGISVRGASSFYKYKHTPEVEEATKFLNQLGARIEVEENVKIDIKPDEFVPFKGITYRVVPEMNEAVFFSSAAILTGGNISIKGVERAHILSYLNFLSKLGGTFEYSEDSLKVWTTGKELQSTELTSTPFPGFLTEWVYAASVLLTQATGKSRIHDTMKVNRFDFTRELNRMGANIKLFRPFDLGIDNTMLDSEYDSKTQGEPYSVAIIQGPTKLKGIKTTLKNNVGESGIVLASLAAEGKSEISNSEYMLEYYSEIYEKLETLGVKISKD